MLIFFSRSKQSRAYIFSVGTLPVGPSLTSHAAGGNFLAAGCSADKKIADEENIDNSSLILVCYIVLKYSIKKVKRFDNEDSVCKKR